MTRAVIYARYSSDLQSDRSIEDQVALCRRLSASSGGGSAMTDEVPLDAHDQALIDEAWKKHEAVKPLTPAQCAYALLWRSKSCDALVNRARRELLVSMSKEEQREAIAWVMAQAGPMTDGEMIAADIRVGVFPEKSYP